MYATLLLRPCDLESKVNLHLFKSSPIPRPLPSVWCVLSHIFFV